jgi:hypothetical protein
MMKSKVLALFGALAVIVGVGAVGIGSTVSIEACTPAQSAEVKSFEKVILANIDQTLPIVESAVVAFDPALAPFAGDVDAVIVDTIQLLEDSGLLGDAGAGNAEALKSQAAAKRDALKPPGSVPQRVIGLRRGGGMP